jgi:regulator of protease activity HflC (stomatin/prohibitin superfamily)
LSTKKLLTSISIAAIVLLFVSSLFINGISSGTVGVVTRFGKVTGRVMNPGIHLRIPFADSVVVYNTKKLTYETMEYEKWDGSNADYKDYPITTTTKDGQGVAVTYTIRFSVDPNKATWVLQNIGSEEDSVEKIVKTESRGWLRTLVRGFTAADLYSGNLGNISAEAMTILTPTFETNGLVLDGLVIREPRFDPAYEAIMEAKQTTKEGVEVEEYKAEQAEHRKAAKISEAQAEAEAQRLLSNSASDKSIEMKRLEVELVRAERWNGAYPTHMYMFGSESGVPLLNIPME